MAKRDYLKTEEFTLALFLIAFLLFILSSPDEVLTGITNSLTGYVVSDLSSAPNANGQGLLDKGKSYLINNYLLVIAVFLSLLILVFITAGAKALINSRKNNKANYFGSVTPPPQPGNDKSEPMKKWRSKKDLPLLTELGTVNKELFFLNKVDEEKGMRIEQVVRKEPKPVISLSSEKKNPRKVILASSYQGYNRELDYVNKELASLGVIEGKHAFVKKEIPAAIKKTSTSEKEIIRMEKPVLKEPERRLELTVKDEFVKRKNEIKEEKILEKKAYPDLSAHKYSSPREALNDADKISKEIRDLVRDYFAGAR